MAVFGGPIAASPARSAAIVLAAVLPIALLYSRSGAEILIGGLDALFLARSVVRRSWSWLNQGWIWAAALWWAWLIVCSTPVPALDLGESGWRSLLQAVLLGRFFLLAAALATWVLREAAARRLVLGMVAGCAGWIVLQCWQQYALGSNLAGWPRWADGALTGPFREPRAGPALVLILFPAVLPVTSALLADRRAWVRGAGVAIFVLAVATVVLIGQRMPALLTGLGLIACAVALPRWRAIVFGAAASAGALIAATPLISPPTFQKLVVHFSSQMHHFTVSSYGLLYVRAVVMGLAHPLTGLGFDGFRRSCLRPEYQHGLAWLGVSDAAAAGPAGCNIHPHNHYLEAFTSGGVPGLALFCALIAIWLVTLSRGLRQRAVPERVGCFTGVLIAVWPFASTSAFFTLPNAGWLFLVLGAGLALAPARPLGRWPVAAGGQALRFALPAGD